MSPDLTKQEAAVYDRQLRVWGVEVQKRFNAARILLLGCTSGIGAEVAKNVVLAGVGTVTLVDNTPCGAGALYSFLVPAGADPAQSVAEASAATLREMNPLVHVAARRARGAGANPNPDAALLEGVDVAVLTGASASPALAWDAACRAAGVAFYAAACRGSASHFFADLGEHMYTPTDKESVGRLGAGAEASSSFPPLEAALFRPWKGLHPRRTHKLFFVLRICAEFERQHGRAAAAADLPALSELGAALAAEHGAPASVVDSALLGEYVTLGDQELPPVSAVLGGVLANEVLKAVSRRGEPVNNFFFFCLADGAGVIERIVP